MTEQPTRPGYIQLEYIDGLAKVYQTADLIVVRAGAGRFMVQPLGCLSAVPLPIGNGDRNLMLPA